MLLVARARRVVPGARRSVVSDGQTTRVARLQTRMCALCALDTFVLASGSLLNEKLGKVILLFLWQTIEPLRTLKEELKTCVSVKRQAELLKAKVRAQP